ncbi:hypothetical protein FSP39_005642 [Pinctada imbricata]|uniref:Uncharacterized protein n=1 Tax=Pinctada imbricata TaxID=66713 RepID=A0AA89BMZ6_PINIB|nr:hypothetical protein FSP39_005642 [Pinctada imbricata]
MAAPGEDVTSISERKYTPARLEDLSKEVKNETPESAEPRSTSVSPSRDSPEICQLSPDSRESPSPSIDEHDGSRAYDSPHRLGIPSPSASNLPSIIRDKLSPPPPGSDQPVPDPTVYPEEPRPPWKGVLVQCAKLWSYLSSISTFERANMLRKGREVHKIYVDVIKGKTFLDDQFAYTEFGRMVLQNGTIRAGRAKNAKQIVVARETLYCSGSGACKRACGGYGECAPGCEKTKMRGHKCSYRVKLTMRLGFVNHWFVEVLGDHEQFGSLNDSMYGGTAQSPTIKSMKSSVAAKSDQDGATLTDVERGTPPTSRLPDSMKLEGAPIAMLPPVLSTMPNSVASFSNSLPNSMISSQPMTLPINLPNNIPAISQSFTFPSPNLQMFSIGANAAMPTHTDMFNNMSMPHILPPYCQDVPLPLVKIKKEITENGYENEAYTKAKNLKKEEDFSDAKDVRGLPNMDSSNKALNEGQMYGEEMTHARTSPKSSVKDGRAKVRKRFTPSHVLNTAFKENPPNGIPNFGY